METTENTIIDFSSSDNITKLSHIKDYINSPYTSSIYTYIDSDDVTPVTSIQQDLQKIFFPGIVTGSSAFGFGGRIVTTGSTADAAVVSIASNSKGSIGFVGTANPVTFANTVTMSFASISDNNVNFAGSYNFSRH